MRRKKDSLSEINFEMKQLLFVLIIIYIVLGTGCEENNKRNYKNKESNLESNIKQQETKKKKYISEYFQENISFMKYEGQSIFQEIQEFDIVINMEILRANKTSRIFNLTLNPIQGVPDERLIIGCFYEIGEVIYKIVPTDQNLDNIISSGEIPKDSIIVCNGTEITDELEKDKKGFHHYININDDEIAYNSYNNLVETGYYESFTWKKGVGLIFYKSGYGAECNSIRLKLTSDKE